MKAKTCLLILLSLLLLGVCTTCLAQNTPGYNNKIPESILTPDHVETPILKHRLGDSAGVIGAALTAAVTLQVALGCWQYRAHIPWRFTFEMTGWRYLGLPMGIATLTVFNASHGLGDLAGLPVDRTRGPVGAADFVEHGAANAYPRIGLEAGPLARVIVAAGLDQTNHSGLDQVLGLHRRRQAIHQVVGDSFDQRRMPRYQVIKTLLRCRSISCKIAHSTISP